MMCLLLFVPASSSHAKLIYSDETYKVYTEKNFSWIEIRLKDGDLGDPIYYQPRTIDFRVWERIHITEKGIFSADIFYKNLPPPFSLLLTSDMIYINTIIHYPKRSAFIIVINGEPRKLLTILLDKVKNV